MLQKGEETGQPVDLVGLSRHGDNAFQVDSGFPS